MEEIKEVELRSSRGKSIYNRTYNPVGLNKVSHFSRRGRAPSRLPMEKLKSLLKKIRKVRLFVWKGILKNTPLSSKIHCSDCYVKNRNGLYLNRYRSNCKSVRFLLRASPKLFRKDGNVYLSSKHKRRSYLGGVRHQSGVLNKYLPICTCNYPFYSAYKSLIHPVNFSQFNLSTDIEKNPGPSFYVYATKKYSCSILSGRRCSVWGKCGTTMCCNQFVCFN